MKKDELKHLQANEAKWDQWAQDLDSPSRRRDYLRDAQRKLIALINPAAGIRFLDIGCGTGWAVEEAARAAGGQGQFYGVDLSAKMIEKAQSRLDGRENFHFLQANVDSIPLGDGSFDVIICTHSFHHYLHPDRAVKEMYRLLGNGGKTYILDPSADSWIVKVADRLIKIVEPEHVKIYSTEEYRRLFAGAGLKFAGSARVNSHAKIQIGEK